MAYLSDLVRTVAAVEGLDEGLVAQYARAAREAGLISQSGRGRSAARMTFRDGGALLTAVNTATLAKDVKANVEGFQALRHREDLSFYTDMDLLLAGGSGVSFGSALEHLLRAFAPDRCARLEELFDAEILDSSRHEATKQGQEIGHAWLEVVFKRPRKLALFRIMVPYIFKGESKWIVAYSEMFHVPFGSNSAEKGFRSSGPDRSDSIIITHRTLKAVAEVLAT